MRDADKTKPQLIEEAAALRKEIREIKEKDSIYRSLVESTDDSIYLVDNNYQYLFMNKKHLLRLNLLSEQFMQLTYSDIHSPLESNSFKEKIDGVFETGASEQYEYKSERDGKYFLQTFSPVKGIDGKTVAVSVISKNITRLKEMEEKLRTLSFTDDLTGLYNRRGFFTLSEQQLKMAKRGRKKMFLMSADLNHLKLINDQMGHKAGDKALTSTAHILGETFRESDIVARIGGDEFVVLGMDMQDSSIEHLTDRLLDNLQAHNLSSDKPLGELSLSFGFSSYDPEHPSSIDEMLSQADELMYKDKKNKK